MPGEDAYRVEGRVIEVLSDRTWRVELVNGHRLVAFAAKNAGTGVAGIKPGETVKLQLSPFDLSTGRLLAGKKTS